ncbi:MAG: helix-turn-helix domain-containing protein [Planctomycetes bacterium]|nr:helix-turn-helix domain-containing protein [Planctomycetota bacterium]
MEPQPILAELGRRLRTARLAADLSVSDLARHSGVSRRHVTEAEAGRANLTVTTLHALAESLGLRAGELVDFDVSALRAGRIALLGLRGAGKSSVGRALALALEVPFVELDQRIEEQTGMALAAIFDLHGVAGFRRMEREALEAVLSGGGSLVLATGGSLVRASDTFARLRQTCHTVWLRARPEEHYQRVAAQGDVRPMRGRPEAMAELRALLSEREADYARCELTLDTSGRGVPDLAAELAARFSAG